MVPVDFITFFSVLAGVGATLFGLIFVAISIKPEVTTAGNPAVMRQVQIASAYGALLNPLVISLFALRPQATIGTITVILSAIGLGSTLIMGMSLVRDARNGEKILRSGLFVVGSLVLFGFELFEGIRLEVVPADHLALDDLTTVLVVIYLYGIARAWDMVGARQFHVQDLLISWAPDRLKDMLSGASAPSPTEQAKDESKQ